MSTIPKITWNCKKGQFESHFKSTPMVMSFKFLFMYYLSLWLYYIHFNKVLAKNFVRKVNWLKYLQMSNMKIAFKRYLNSSTFLMLNFIILDFFFSGLINTISTISWYFQFPVSHIRFWPFAMLFVWFCCDCFMF